MLVEDTVEVGTGSKGLRTWCGGPGGEGHPSRRSVSELPATPATMEGRRVPRHREHLLSACDTDILIPESPGLWLAKTADVGLVLAPDQEGKVSLSVTKIAKGQNRVMYSLLSYQLLMSPGLTQRGGDTELTQVHASCVPRSSDPLYL